MHTQWRRSSYNAISLENGRDGPRSERGWRQNYQAVSEYDGDVANSSTPKMLQILCLNSSKSFDVH